MTQPRGFTLVEMLVVVVIVGVLAGAVTLVGGAHGDGYRLREEAQRLAAVVRLVADEAVLDNREYGIRLHRHGYEIRRYEGSDGCWHEVSGWAAHPLPETMQLTLMLEGAPLLLAAQSVAQAPPQILLSSSGQGTPFSAGVESVANPARFYRIDSDGMSDAQVSEGGAQ